MMHGMRRRFAGLAVVSALGLLAGGCQRSTPVASEPQATNEAADGASPGTETPPKDATESNTTEQSLPIKLPHSPGLHNLVRVSERIFSGSEPHGEEGFESLAKLGIKTVVSVDGAKPQLEAAHKHGMTYVHIPIGYDKIEHEAALALSRVGRQSAGPIYVHCHHGQHRGPAAAAVACRAADDRSGQQALKILEVAGTGKQYPGLWRDVAAFTPPAASEALPDLVEVARVESFAAAMAKIDRNYDNIKLCEKAEWSVPPDHPDLVPAQEALILKEGFRETARNLVADRPAEFQAWMAEAADTADRLEAAVRLHDHAAATAEFRRIDASCKQCHAKYRN